MLENKSLVSAGYYFWKIVLSSCHELENFHLGTFSFISPVIEDEGYFHDAIVVTKCLTFMAFIHMLKMEIVLACIV